MSRKALRTVLVTLGVALLPLTAGQAANAAITAKPAVSPVTGQPNVIPVRTCWKRYGPFVTQHTAWRYVRAFRARGYRTSGVWGQGGSIAYSRRMRGYYFRVFYNC
jgi:hypothetical protein